MGWANTCCGTRSLNETTMHGGETAGIPNSVLLRDMLPAAHRFQNRASFCYANGVQYADKVRQLGAGGTKSLPVVAINAVDGGSYHLSVQKKLSASRITRFVDDFFRGVLEKEHRMYYVLRVV